AAVAAREPGGQGDAGQGEERRGKPGGELVHPQERVGGGDDPEEGGRLVEVAGAVDVRRDEVARREHLARDLGVAPFVGIAQPRPAQAIEDDRGAEQQQEEDRSPGPLAAGRPTQAHSPVARGASSTSRTLRTRAATVNGFSSISDPGARTPWWTMASPV